MLCLLLDSHNVVMTRFLNLYHAVQSISGSDSIHNRRLSYRERSVGGHFTLKCLPNPGELIANECLLSVSLPIPSRHFPNTYQLDISFIQMSLQNTQTALKRPTKIPTRTRISFKRHNFPQNPLQEKQNAFNPLTNENSPLNIHYHCSPPTLISILY